MQGTNPIPFPVFVYYENTMIILKAFLLYLYLHACSLAYKEDFCTCGNMDVVGRPTGSVGLVAEPLVVNT